MAFQCSMRGLKAHKVHQRQAVCQSHLPVPGVPLQSVQRVSASQSARTAHVHQGASKPARAAMLVPRAYGAPGTSYDTNPYSQTGSSSQFGGGQRQQQQGSTALASLDQGGAALKAKEQPKMVAVRFWLKFHVDYGQSIRIIGGHEAMGAWNLAKAPFLRWSEGDLWNVTLEVAAGGVIEYKYVVVEGDGTVAASWQRGANNVLALQLNDEEVEVYDNWKNTPGALVLVDGQEITRERKLLAWASDMSLQRSELRRTRMELAQAREEIRVLRAELSVLRMEVSEANIARAAAEARQLELERKNSALRLEIAASNASARSTMEEAARLLNDMSDDDSGMNGGMGMSSSSGMSDAGSGGSPTYASANAPAGAGSSSSGSHGSGGGMFGSLFGFNMPGGNGKVQSRAAPDAEQRPSNAASAVVAAAAAMAAAADPWRQGQQQQPQQQPQPQQPQQDGGAGLAGAAGTYSPQSSNGTRSYNPNTTPGSSEVVSANSSS
uniref:CBM20 domain-containing protein n=1 Tax=Tetradesmus obliquus TaxID=3088 RepID=A0A383WKL3_TETOB|eukprot:jgi/Sobl393_1/18354/SZX77951.1